jgi:hypothetical protein
MKDRAKFREAASWSLKLVRYAVGVVGVLAIYVGLDALFESIAPEASGLGYGLRYLRYALVALWVTYIAPWIFLRVKLAKPKKR